MTHVFLLLVYIGVGDGRQLASNDLYFKSISECNWFASQVAKRFGSYGSLDGIDPKDRVTAYCVPQYVTDGSVRVY